MHRIPFIQNLFDAARLSRQNGSTTNLSPYFYSIYDDGLVKESNNALTCILDDPCNIVCCTVLRYYEYGWREDSQIFCYVNRRGDASSELALNKWSLQDIKLFENSLISGASMRLLRDPSQIFSFNYESGTPIKSFQILWNLFSEINASCSTVKEAEFYFKYFDNKLELDQANYTLEDYREQLQESKDINKQYQDLLEKISTLVGS